MATTDLTKDSHETDINKDDAPRKPINLRRELSEMFDILVNKGINPHEYYDFENDQIRSFPPVSKKHNAKLDRCLQKSKHSLNKLERKLSG